MYFTGWSWQADIFGMRWLKCDNSGSLLFQIPALQERACRHIDVTALLIELSAIYSSVALSPLDFEYKGNFPCPSNHAGQ